MKKLFMFIVLICFCSNTFAQKKLYLLFEFMKVDNNQEQAYWDTETFWEKIHDQRVKNGDILGWDLWSLQPGGVDQGYQYLTVQVYDDPVKMMSGIGDFQGAAKKAYPNMSEDDFMKKMQQTTASRALAMRLYIEQIDRTKDNFTMPIGTVAALNLMKVTPDKMDKYENAESKIFKPFHQKRVDSGQMAHWTMLRIISPYGSDTNASHITADMYKDYKQYFSNNAANIFETANPAQLKIYQDGAATRDLKWSYFATLVKTIN